MLVIIDYKVGNIGSLLNMCRYIGIDAIISSNKKDILNASKIILPGVGSFDHCMKNINKSEILETLEKSVFEQKKPILGICAGMQIMALKSEEGNSKGLGWINASVLKIKPSQNYKVPHMGWARINLMKKSLLLHGSSKNARYYFSHSYHVSCENPRYVSASLNHSTKIDVAFEKNNIFGVQFHPEKSHDFGMRVIKNFSNIN